MTDTNNPQQQSGNNNRPWLPAYPVDVDWHADVQPSTMVDMFRESVKKYADRTCLNFQGNKFTFAEVDRLSDAFAASLQDQCVVKGTRIGLCLPNTPFYPIAYYGAMKAGATIVNLNPLYAEQEMQHLLNDSGAEMVVTINVADIQAKAEKMLDGRTGLKKVILCDLGDALPGAKGKVFKNIIAPLKRMVSGGSKKGFFGRIAEKLRGKLAAIPETVKIKTDATHLSFKKMIAKKRKPKPVTVTPDDLAVLQYTGGTTALPKAAMLSHANLTSNLEQANLWFATGEKMTEKTLAVLPFFHVLSMTVQMNLSICRGGELIMLPKFDLKETLKTIDKEKPTMFAGVPSIYKAIIDCKTVGNYDLSSMKVCLSGGAAMSQPVMDGFKKLTGIDIVEGYGLSETAPLATANPLTGGKKIASVGLPVPQTDVRIVDHLADFPGAEQPINVTGEICLRGPQVMKGYWNRAEDNKTAIDADGFFHTGDLGHLDSEGYLFITGRKKEMINRKGMKVYPNKVEAAILQHPSVSEVIVAGWPAADDPAEEITRAFIVMKEGEKELTRSEWKEFLKDKLAPYEAPDKVDYHAALPKTMIGKPDKKALLAQERAKTPPAPKP
jgi:long-chain acyl-CoA synthetase